VHKREATLLTRAEYFAEEVRRELLERYGETQLYRGGLSVRTTLEPKLQAIADRVLRDGRIAYDRRHGWRGPIARLEGRVGEAGPGPGWAARLAKDKPPPALGSWRLAVVLAAEKQSARIGLQGGGEGTIPLAELRWARAWIKGQKRGPPVRGADQVLKPGDVIAVEAVSERVVKSRKRGKDPEIVAYPPRTFALRQIPDINGAVVALDPHTGRVLAMSGGLDYTDSQFNRATQALRQPGSAFKPFVYLAALNEGFTPSSLILDAPFVIDQGPGVGLWKPHNYARKFYGPSTMRLGLEKSRNLMKPCPGLGGGGDDPSPAVDGLCHAGERGQKDHAEPDRPHSGPPGPHHPAPRQARLHRLPGRTDGRSRAARDPRYPGPRGGRRQHLPGGFDAARCHSARHRAAY
jgi:penicillin-binding protein 1A